jgi:hypothetical protein
MEPVHGKLIRGNKAGEGPLRRRVEETREVDMVTALDFARNSLRVLIGSPLSAHFCVTCGSMAHAIFCSFMRDSGYVSTDNCHHIHGAAR